MMTGKTRFLPHSPPDETPFNPDEYNGDIDEGTGPCDEDLDVEGVDTSIETIERDADLWQRRIAMSKPIIDCTIDEIIRYRADEVFPSCSSGSPQRTSHISIYCDSYYFTAIRQLRREHAMIRPSIRYVAIAIGFQKILMDHPDQCYEIDNLVRYIDNSGRDGLIDEIPRERIAGTGKQEKVGFTEASAAGISEAAERLGVTESGLLLVSFWKMAITAKGLKPSVKRYGEEILRKFEEHLETRIVVLRHKKLQAQRSG